MLKFNDTSIFTQRFLKCCGLYTGKIDGDIGPMSLGAMAAFEQIHTNLIAKYGKFDDQTEESITFLLPEVQKAARKFMVQVKQINFAYKVRLISGLRTYKEQSAIYAQGRTTPGRIVTKSKAGFSYHNFGIAWDVGIYSSSGQYLDEDDYYIEFGNLIAPRLTIIDWGGKWKSFIDNPHYQYRTGLSISEIRNRFENGIIIVPWVG